MNLHEIVSGAISSINPFQDITIRQSAGYTVDEYGETTPLYSDPITVKADVQPITSEDTKFISNYNESSVYRSFWVNGSVFGLNRPLNKGGDLIVCNGKTYKTISVPEDWSETAGWTRFMGVLQLEG